MALRFLSAITGPVSLLVACSRQISVWYSLMYDQTVLTTCCQVTLLLLILFMYMIQTIPHPVVL